MGEHVRGMCSLLLFLLFASASSVQRIGINTKAGLSGKFRNMSARKVRLYWVSHSGEAKFTCTLDAMGGESSFQTYAGHSFFFAELLVEPPVPIEGKGALGARFIITQDQRIYTFIDDSTPPKLVDELQTELQFMRDYYQANGRHWIAYYPRRPPVFPMWACDAIGQKHEVTLSEDAGYLACSHERCKSKKKITLTIECISQRPRTFFVEEFVSNFECSHFIFSVMPFMQNSSASADKLEKSLTHPRGLIGSTASSTSNRIVREGLFAETIFRRAAQVMKMPQEVFWHDRNVESINVLKYDKGQHYTPHYDWGSHGSVESRFTSMVVYFSKPAKGGETSFPKGYNADGSQYVIIKPKKRGAIFFYNLLEDGNVDEYSLRAEEVVKKGLKWVGAMWTWEPHTIGGRSPHDVLDRLDDEADDNTATSTGYGPEDQDAAANSVEDMDYREEL